MPIDPDLATSTVYPDGADAWDEDRIILYHLGLGAGASVEPGEVAYVSERKLKVLPTFSVIPGFEGVRPAVQGPGLDYRLARMLHGEQELVVHAPLPVRAEVITHPSVEAVYDTGTAALAVLKAETSTVEGTLLCTNWFKLFIRGEGGFGGDAPARVTPPATVGPPDLDIEVQTLPQQAAIYRLSGDRNPLHLDPGFARKAGFDRPILHGLCTWGVACKAIVDHLLDGSPGAVRGWRARMAAPVFPGEALRIQAWKSDLGYSVRADVVGREAAAITNGQLTV
jgi:acyl dehydratase